jgi:hypothetical protein
MLGGFTPDQRRTVYETTWTDCRQVVEVQFGPGHDCGRLTGKPEVGRGVYRDLSGLPTMQGQRQRTRFKWSSAPRWLF